MIKKMIFFLVFSIMSLAQQVELKSVERIITTDKEKSVISISQTYNEKTKKLEVLYIEKGLNPYTSKTFIQYDKDGKKELSNEEYRYSPSTKKWERDNKRVTTYKNNKEIVMQKQISGLNIRNLKMKRQIILILILLMLLRIKNGLLFLKHIFY